jgi:hypothetical protein
MDGIQCASPSSDQALVRAPQPLLLSQWGRCSSQSHMMAVRLAVGMILLRQRTQHIHTASSWAAWSSLCITAHAAHSTQPPAGLHGPPWAAPHTPPATQRARVRSKFCCCASWLCCHLAWVVAVFLHSSCFLVSCKRATVSRIFAGSSEDADAMNRQTGCTCSPCRCPGQCQ